MNGKKELILQPNLMKIEKNYIIKKLLIIIEQAMQQEMQQEMQMMQKFLKERMLIKNNY